MSRLLNRLSKIKSKTYNMFEEDIHLKSGVFNLFRKEDKFYVYQNKIENNNLDINELTNNLPIEYLKIIRSFITFLGEKNRNILNMNLREHEEYFKILMEAIVEDDNYSETSVEVINLLLNLSTSILNSDFVLFRGFNQANKSKQEEEFDYGRGLTTAMHCLERDNFLASVIPDYNVETSNPKRLIAAFSYLVGYSNLKEWYYNADFYELFNNTKEMLKLSAKETVELLSSISLSVEYEYSILNKKLNFTETNKELYLEASLNIIEAYKKKLAILEVSDEEFYRLEAEINIFSDIIALDDKVARKLKYELNQYYGKVSLEKRLVKGE